MGPDRKSLDFGSSQALCDAKGHKADGPDGIPEASAFLFKTTVNS